MKGVLKFQIPMYQSDDKYMSIQVKKRNGCAKQCLCVAFIHLICYIYEKNLWLDTQIMCKSKRNENEVKKGNQFFSFLCFTHTHTVYNLSSKSHKCILKEVVENKGNIGNSMGSGKKKQFYMIIIAQKLTRSTI